MSITEILEEVRVHKSCGVPQLRRYLRKLKIKPLGCNQKPLNWPNDTSKRILVHLGFDQAADEAANEVATKKRMVVSLQKLQSTRGKFGRGK